MKLSIYTREFYYNMKLAYPVVIGMLGHTLVQLIDNIMVGQLGKAPLAASSVASGAGLLSSNFANDFFGVGCCSHLSISEGN